MASKGQARAAKTAKVRDEVGAGGEFSLLHFPRSKEPHTCGGILVHAKIIKKSTKHGLYCIGRPATKRDGYFRGDGVEEITKKEFDTATANPATKSSVTQKTIIVTPAIKPCYEIVQHQK